MKFFAVLTLLTMVSADRESYYVEGFKDLVNVEDIVIKKGDSYTFAKEVTEFLDDRVIPDLCEMTSDKINLHNSYLLDKQCLEELEGIGPKCREFKCKLAHYIKENGARILGTIFHEESKFGSLKEIADVVNKELSAVIVELELCTCGKRFIKALSNCGPYYFSNAFFDLNDNEQYNINPAVLVLRNVDFDAAGKAANRLMDHLCKKTSRGLCINSIMDVAGRFGDVWQNTFEYDVHGCYQKARNDEKEALIEVYKKCDTLCYVWTKVEYETDSFDDFLDLYADRARYTKAFFCDEYCWEKRGNFLPCCMKELLRDKRIWDNLQKVGESLYKMKDTLNLIAERYEIPSFYIPPEDYPDEDYERHVTETVRKYLKAVQKVLDGADSCEVEVECSDP